MSRQGEAGRGSKKSQNAVFFGSELAAKLGRISLRGPWLAAKSFGSGNTALAHSPAIPAAALEVIKCGHALAPNCHRMTVVDTRGRVGS